MQNKRNRRLSEYRPTIPAEVWNGLDDMAAIVETILAHYGPDMRRDDKAGREKSLANAHRILDTYGKEGV